MKNKIVLTIVALIGFLTLPVWSQDLKDMKEMVTPSPVLAPPISPFYIAVEGGAGYSNGYQKNHAEAAVNYTRDYCGRQTPHYSTQNTLKNGSGWGAVAGLKGGYSFSPTSIGASTQWFIQPSVEIEGLYFGNSDYDAGAIFLNGIVSLKNPSRVMPYIGAGVGGEYVSAGLANDRGFGVAIQAIGGVNIAINTRWSVFTEYHFIDNPSHNINQNVGLIGVKYNF